MLSKTLLTLTVLVGLSLPTFAQIQPSQNVAEAQAQAVEKCVKGCLVLSPAEADEIMLGIEQSKALAFRQGTLSCRNAIKYIP